MTCGVPGSIIPNTAMEKSTWILLALLSSCFGAYKAASYPLADVTWTDAGYIVGAYRSVSAVCRVRMHTLPNGEREVPPDLITISFTAGNQQGNVSFNTKTYTDDLCTASRTVSSTYGDALNSLDEGAFTRECQALEDRLSTSKCAVDIGGTPNREITVIVNPFTHLEATRWVCMPTWYERGTLSSELPRPTFAPVWEGDSMPQLVALPFEVGRPSKLVCTLDGYEREVAFPAGELARYDGQNVPYRPVRFVLSAVHKDCVDYSELGSVWRDFHGRLNSSTANVYHSELPGLDFDCTRPNTPIHTCFSDAPNTGPGIQNQLTSGAICDGYDAMVTRSLVTSMAPYTAPRVSLIGDHPFEIDSLLVDFDEQCVEGCTPTTAPLIDIRITSPHLLMQIPRIVKPIQLTNIPTTNVYRHDTPAPTEFVSKLVITPELMAQFYRYHVEMMAEYKRYRVFLMPHPTINEEGFVQTTISCGSNSAAFLVLMSGSCEIEGLDTSSHFHCGPGDNHRYEWHKLINRGSKIHITKRKYGKNFYVNHLMTCAWRAYICYSEPRYQNHEKLHGITLVEQQPGMPYVVGMTNREYIRYDYMLPSECPMGEAPDDLALQSPQLLQDRLPTFNLSMADIPREINLQFNQSLSLLKTRLSVNIPLYAVHTKCPCREQVSFCDPGAQRSNASFVATAPPNIDLAVMTTQPRSRIHCEVFERRSKLVTYEDLGEQAACTNTYRGLSTESETALLALMPRPKVVVAREPNMWGRNLYRISCSGNRKTCIDRTTIDGADPDSELGIRFRGMKVVEFYASVNTSEPMMELLQNGSYAILAKWALAEPEGIRWDARDETTSTDYSMSMVVDYAQVLNNYTDIECMYKNGRVVSETVSVKDAFREADAYCEKLDYTVEMRYTPTHGDDRLAKMQCSVNYSSVRDSCGRPNVAVWAVDNRGEDVYSVICLAASPNPSDWRTVVSGVVNNEPGYGCSYFEDRVVGMIHLDRLVYVTHSLCRVVDETNGVNFTEKLVVSDLPVGCSQPPPDFLPTVHAQFDQKTKITTVSCRYPDWASAFMCVQEGMPTTDVEVIVLYRSLIRPASPMTIAIRHTEDGKCTSHPTYVCSTGKLPDKLLVSVLIPPWVLNDFMGEPAPEALVQCRMGERYTDLLPLKDTVAYLSPKRLEYVPTRLPTMKTEEVPAVTHKKTKMALIIFICILGISGVIATWIASKWVISLVRKRRAGHYQPAYVVYQPVETTSSV